MPVILVQIYLKKIILLGESLVKFVGGEGSRCVFVRVCLKVRLSTSVASVLLRGSFNFSNKS